MASDLLAILFYNYVHPLVDMHEKCTLCGAGDGTLSHPDYVDWVSSRVSVCIIYIRK